MVRKGLQEPVRLHGGCDPDAVRGGRCGHLHGSLQAGALTTTFTSSQGLMLMIPAMYAMGGQFLPNVMHIASRVVTSNHHSIFGDHTDFMTCRTTATPC